jgi:LPXTG-motif cell wall-anchored protein
VTTTGTSVAGVQTTPAGTTSQVGAQTAGQQQGAVLGVETLPSTSTGTVPFMALGGILMSLGAWLLRKPARPTD